MKKVLSFLSEPFSTDELKAKLEQTRDELNGKALYQTQLAGQLSRVEIEALSMQSKSNYLVNLSGQTLEMFVPAPASELETDYDAMKDKYYDPIKDAYTYGGAAGAVVWFLGGAVLPGTLKVVGALAKSQKIARLAKSTKLMKLAKLGKATVYLAVVVAIFEVALRMVTAKKMNDHLRKEQKTIEDQNLKADQVIAKYEVAIEQGKKLIQAFLDETGVESLEDYEDKLNEAIGDVAEQAAYSKMARNMLRIGMDAETVANVVPDLKVDVVRAIEQRLNAEIMLLSGETPEIVGQNLQMTRLQLALVARVLQVREDAVLGWDDHVLMERHKVSDAVADLQVDLAESGLETIWDKVTTQADPDTLAKTLIVSARAVKHLQSEVQARSALLEGAAVDTVVQAYPEVGAKRIAEIAEEIPLIREDIIDSPAGPEKLAVEWRVFTSSIETLVP